MKKAMNTLSALAVVGCVVLALGCGDKTLVTVKVISTKYEYKGGFCEMFPHTVVERTDTHERVMIQGAWGGIGDTFAIQKRNLRWK